MACLTTVSFAGSTSTTVPVTITYTGGCNIANLSTTLDLGTVPTVMSNTGEVMNPLTFDLTCSSGLSYSITTNATQYTMQANGTGSTYGMKFYQDASKTNLVMSNSPWNRTATGSTETVTLYPNVYPITGCSLDSGTGKYTCDAGTLTASVNLIISW
ncbi:MAG: hypothetical protein R3331_05280 [Sulfurospirillaceae bacterium]|nr:hypothetical protein [Sulfurospirillaceae bacterium]